MTKKIGGCKFAVVDLELLFLPSSAFEFVNRGNNQEEKNYKNSHIMTKIVNWFLIGFCVLVWPCYLHFFIIWLIYLQMYNRQRETLNGKKFKCKKRSSNWICIVVFPLLLEVREIISVNSQRQVIIKKRSKASYFHWQFFFRYILLNTIDKLQHNQEEEINMKTGWLVWLPYR